MCDEEDKVSCRGCSNDFEPTELGNDGLCAECHELDPTPTSDECEHCDKPAVTNICGTDLCEDCLEHYHH